MTILAGAGTKTLDNAYESGRLATEEALVTLNGRTPSLMLAFITHHYNAPEVIRGIYQTAGQAPLMGCHAGGIISSEGASKKGVVVLALQADSLEVTLASESGISDHPVEISERVAERIENKIPPAGSGKHVAALILANGFARTLEEVLHSTATFMGPLCPLVGGGSGNVVDTNAFGKNLFVNGQCFEDALAIALLNSPAAIGIGVSHGWTPIGRPLVVTRTQGHIVLELNGRSAFEVYCDLFPKGNLTLDNFAPFVSAHPLGLPQVSGEFIIRDPMQTYANGSIEFTATIPENTVTHIMQADQASLCSAAQAAAQQALNGLGGKPVAAAFVFDCVSRLNFLGVEADTEVNLIRDILGRDTPLAGMFSFGEFATAHGPAAFHNKTVVVCALGQE